MRLLLSVALAVLALPVRAEGPAHDMAKMWQTSLARQPIAVTATFDARGRLWRASVSDGHVWVDRSDDEGRTYGKPAMVNPEREFVSADGENRPKLLVDGDKIYVSYTRAGEAMFSGDVRFSRSVDGGRHFAAPLTVNDNREPIAHRFDAMALDGRGRIHLVWLDKRDASAAVKRGEKYAGISVYRAVSENGGKSFGANERLAEHSCECCRIAIATDVDGVPVAVWRHIFDGGVRDHALARLDGKSGPMRLSHENWQVAACPHHGPAISIANDGVYHAAWFSNAAQQKGLFYAHSADRGKAFSAPLNFGKPAVQAAHPTVLSQGKKVLLAWKEFDGERTRIMLMRSEDGGDSWGEPAGIAETADASDSPMLVAKGARVFLSWNTKNEGHRMIEAAR